MSTRGSGSASAPPQPQIGLDLLEYAARVGTPIAEVDVLMFTTRSDTPASASKAEARSGS